MALDGNERKILYRNLINDPATQAETKKYSFTDWERKLLGDEKAIGKLAQFSVGRNWAIDENDFVERYVPELIAPPAPKQKPAPVAAPVEQEAYIPEPQPLIGSSEYNNIVRELNPFPTPGLGETFGGTPAVFETKEQRWQEEKSPVFKAHNSAFVDNPFSPNPYNAPIAEEQRRAQRDFAKATKQQQQAALRGGTGAELQQQREDEKLTKAEIVGEEANKFLSGINRAVYKTPSAIAKTIGELGVGVINMLGGDMKSEESVLYNLADKYDKWLDTSEIARDWIGDPRYKGLATDVGSGLGQIATMIAAGPGSASRALMSSPGVIKAVAQKMFSRPSLIAGAQVFNSEYENMKAKGESDETAFKQALTNWFATAPLENLPIVNLAERLNKTVGVQATRRIINAIQQGVDEGGQETLQQLFSNFSNNALVELNKNVVDWTEGLQPSAEAGGVVGLLIGALANARAAKRYTTKPAEAPGVQAIPAEEVQGTGRRVVVDSIEEVPAELRDKVIEVSGPLGRFGIGKKQYVYFEPTETIDITPQAPAEVTPESAVIEEPPIEELTPVTEETEQVTVPPLTEEELAQIEETELTPEEEAALLAQEETAPVAPAEEAAPEAAPEIAEIEKRRKELKDRFYGRRANQMSKYNPGGRNEELTQDEIDEIEAYINAAKEKGYSAEKLFGILNKQGYVYTLDNGPFAFNEYLKARLAGDIDVKVNDKNFFAEIDKKFDDEIAALNKQAAPAPQTEEVVSAAPVEEVAPEAAPVVSEIEKQNTFTRDDLKTISKGTALAKKGAEVMSSEKVESQLRPGDEVTFFAERERKGVWDGKMIREVGTDNPWGVMGILADVNGFIRNDTKINEQAAPVEEVAPEAPASPAMKGRKKKEAPVTPAPVTPKKEAAPKPEPKKEAPKPEAKKEEAPTEEKPVSGTPQEGDKVEIAPQREGFQPRAMVFKDGQWQQNVGGDIVKVGSAVQQQAQEAFSGKAEVKPAETKEGKKAEAKEEKVTTPEFTSQQSSEAATAFDKAKTSKGFDKKYGKGAYKALSDITKNFDAIMDKVSDKIKQDCL